MLQTLSCRIKDGGTFPHEIGLFLGYPPEDVLGFITDSCHGDCRNCKLVGCWKVYGDESAAKDTFAKFKKCRDVYLDRWRSGSNLWKLTVSLPS